MFVIYNLGLQIMFHIHMCKTFVCKFITTNNWINHITDSYTRVRIFFSIMLLDAIHIYLYYDSKMENMKMNFPLKRSPKLMKSLRIYWINKIPFMLQWSFEDVLLDRQFHRNIFLYFLGHENVFPFLIRHFYSVKFVHLSCPYTMAEHYWNLSLIIHVPETQDVIKFSTQDLSNWNTIKEFSLVFVFSSKLHFHNLLHVFFAKAHYYY